VGTTPLKIALLTSSRADFGIYLPLLKKLKADRDFELEIIAFGSHPSRENGFTLQQIYDEGYKVAVAVDTAPKGDKPADISRSMAQVMVEMTRIWETTQYDLIIALGDRFEMFAAVASTLPFNLKIAHVHGGEVTHGAIDDALRHSITHMAQLHFTVTEAYRNNVIRMLGSEKGVYNTGALSIDNLSSMQLSDIPSLKAQTGIDFSQPTLLVTLHPETIHFEHNENHVAVLIEALKKLQKYQQVITLPNTDTSSAIIREQLLKYAENNASVFVFENMGALNYLSAMKHAQAIVGNSSSGFAEAAYFPKWVINIGNRQGGRLRTPNIVDVPFDAAKIIKAVESTASTPVPNVGPIYGQGNAAEEIIKIIKNECIGNG
jgi:GDP/UDP-N,N'-diacetylbacillosamine 2-epimerase (hydrolysing)